MKKIIFILITFIFIGCSNVKTAEDKHIVSPSNYDFKLHLKNTESSIIEVYDPLESINRRIYYFNSQLDHWVVLPLSYSYSFFLPQTIRTGVKNFFNNLYEPVTVFNGLLTLDSHITFTGFTRFAINTTIGIAGIFDIASLMDIKEDKFTLNETLSYYGVNQGMYLVIPILGPSDLRNISSQLTTFILRNPLDPTSIYTGALWHDLAIKSIGAIDTRSRINFTYYSLGTPFEYEYIRLLYFKASQAKAENVKKKLKK